MPIYRDESGGVGRGVMTMAQSHVLRGPQITGVIVNTFFHRAEFTKAGTDGGDCSTGAG